MAVKRGEAAPPPHACHRQRARWEKRFARRFHQRLARLRWGPRLQARCPSSRQAPIIRRIVRPTQPRLHPPSRRRPMAAPAASAQRGCRDRAFVGHEPAQLGARPSISTSSPPWPAARSACSTRASSTADNAIPSRHAHHAGECGDARPDQPHPSRSGGVPAPAHHDVRARRALRFGEIAAQLFNLALIGGAPRGGGQHIKPPAQRKAQQRRRSEQDNLREEKADHVSRIAPVWPLNALLTPNKISENQKTPAGERRTHHGPPDHQRL